MGIFVFFDHEGIVDEYVDKLLLSMSEILTKLYIVVNGNIKENSKKVLEQYSDNIFIRRNRGFDGGAYKYIILNQLPEFVWKLYDEVVLFNHTFYGPFFSMKNIFKIFTLNQKIDFWGLSKWIGGESLLLSEKNLPAHIQAYFIVVKKSILRSGFWLKFWEEMSEPKNYLDAIKNFEVGFTVYFSERGFRYTTWLEEQGGDELLEMGEVVYNIYPCEMILNFRFPILKHKAVNFYNCSKIIKIASFVEKEYNYDFGMIQKHLKRIQKNKIISPFSMDELEQFYFSHDKIYIFGHGKYGKELESYFLFRKWNICGFVVSDIQGDKDLLPLNEVKLTYRDGIIIALGEKKSQQIKRLLEKKFTREQMLFPIYNYFTDK